MLNLFKQLKRNRKKKQNRKLDKQNHTPLSTIVTDPEFLIKRTEISKDEFGSSFGLNDSNILNGIAPKELRPNIVKEEFQIVINLSNITYTYSEEMEGILITFNGEIVYKEVLETVEKIKLNIEALSQKSAEIISLTT